MVFNMKFLRLNGWSLVVLTLFSLIGAAPMLDDNDHLQQTIKSLQKAMGNLQEEVGEVRKSENDIDHLKKTIKSPQKTMENQQEKLQNLENDKQMTADSMFLATISELTIPISSGEPIVWDSAPINPGGHFSKVLGTYEAPVTGYYQFSVVKYGNDYFGSFYILVDEVRYAYVDEYGSVSEGNAALSGTASINIELTAGQVVRIENVSSTEIYGTDSTGFIYSWFTGHLLYAL